MNEVLEALLCDARETIFGLNKEMSLLQDRVNRSDAALAEAASAQAMAGEVEGLRAQLADVRKQLLKKDIDKETASLSPRDVIEREHQSRQVRSLWMAAAITINKEPTMECPSFCRCTKA